jgi:tRNA(Ser,Leu) C12 N-acetylase TAN1
MGEKTLLIDAHVSEEQRNIELIENYIEFLRQSNKNLESLQFTIKNIIDLFNYLGR